MPTVCRMVWFAAVCFWVPSTQSALVLHLDAASPGANPGVQWEDLSGNGRHFVNQGAGYSPTEQAYLFGGPAPADYCCNGGSQDGPYRGYLERSDEGDSPFRFETGKAGDGKPFSIVAWFEVSVDAGDDFASTLIQKGEATISEWKIRPRSIGGNTELVMNEGNQGSRMFARASETPTGFHLLMITHDGSGEIAGTRISYNGVLNPQNNPDDTLTGSISSTAAIRIGAGHSVGSTSGHFFEGKVGFIEIWDEVLDVQYAVDRYNEGSPGRAAPPLLAPPLLLLLDGSDPGPAPGTAWLDRSGRENHFTNYGARYNPDTGAFCFGGPEPGRTAGLGGVNGGSVDGPFDAYLQLAGSDVDFDFETDVLGELNSGDPFTVVAWLEVGVDPGDDFASVLLQKGADTDPEWKVRPRSVGGSTELIMNEGNQSARLLTRASPSPVDFHLLMISHDGSGRAEGTKFYFNGILATAETPDNTLLTTVASNAPLRIGGGLPNDKRFFEGKLGLLEIWGGVRNQQYAMDRFLELNGGPQLPAAFQDQTAQLAPGLFGLKAAWGDFNNDGYPDLIDGQSIWQNNDGTGFTRILSGMGPGVWGDFNNDGFLDIYFWGNVRAAYRNINGASFADVGTPSPPAGDVRGANWGDWDGDSFLDLYIGGYQVGTSYEPDVILQNNGGANFVTGWQEPMPRNPGRGIASCDFDRDGDLDVYVSNYRLENNVLWRNDGAGAFQDVAGAYGALGGGGHTIGSAWGDLNNDGYIDLFVGNFAHPGQPESQFLKNLGPSGSYHFQDMSSVAALAFQESYASPALGDYDNDGDLDLYFTTVYAQSETTGGALNRAVLYRNDGDFRFKDVTMKEGLAGVETTYQAAWADIDRDGDLDLATNGKIFVNGGNSNHWLKVRLDGRRRGVNAAAIGAQVKVEAGGMTQVRQLGSGTGEGNQNSLVLHFGLGSESGPVNLEILWPGGETEVLTGVEVDRIIDVPLALRPDLTGITHSRHGLLLSWQSEPSRTYRIEKRYTAAAPFFELSTVPSSAPVNEYTDTFVGNDGAFYRVVIEP